MFVAILLLALVMTACGGNNNQPEVLPTTPVTTEPQATPVATTPSPTPEATPVPIPNPNPTAPPEPIAATPATASLIVGEWHLISTDDPISGSGLTTGWGYDTYFFEDGTGIEWWFSPYSGWQEVMHFEWSSNGNGELTKTYMLADFDVIIHYLGMEFAEAVDSIMGTPFVYSYSVANNNLTIGMDGVTSTSRRNQFRETPLITSQLVGEWHMTASDALFYSIGMENDWGYDLYFFDDGTGIEWWFSPDSGWNEIFFFLWFAKDGEFSLTYIDMNYPVVTHYLGEEAALELIDVLYIPSFGEYNVQGNTVEIYFYDAFTHTMHRN